MSVIVSRPIPLDRAAAPASPQHANGVPTVRITVDVPLDRVPLPPQAVRLLELIGELAQPAGGLGPYGAGQSESSPGATVLRHPTADARPWPANQLRVLVGPRVVLLGDEPVPLTRLEFELLRFLAAHPRQVFSRRQLLRSVWRDDLGVSRTVDVHVRRLRAKFGPDVPVVTTVYGVGYRLADNDRILLQNDRVPVSR